MWQTILIAMMFTAPLEPKRGRQLSPHSMQSPEHHSIGPGGRKISPDFPKMAAALQD